MEPGKDKMRARRIEIGQSQSQWKGDQRGKKKKEEEEDKKGSGGQGCKPRHTGSEPKLGRTIKGLKNMNASMIQNVRGGCHKFSC